MPPLHVQLSSIARLAKHTGVRERFAVLHHVRMRVKEVADRGHHFVTNDRVEVTPLHAEIVVVGFDVQLRHGEAVIEIRIGIPARAVASLRAVQTGRGGEEEIAAIVEVDVVADNRPQFLLRSVVRCSTP